VSLANFREAFLTAAPAIRELAGESVVFSTPTCVISDGDALARFLSSVEHASFVWYTTEKRAFSSFKTFAHVKGFTFTEVRHSADFGLDTAALPEADQQRLLAMIERIRVKLGLCTNVQGLEVMRRILLDEFVFACAQSFEGLKLDFERTVNTIVAGGQIDYAFLARALVVLVLGAKREDLTPGTAQAAAEVIAVADSYFLQQKQYHFGVVSSAKEWRFLRVNIEGKIVEWCQAGTLDLAGANDPNPDRRHIFDQECVILFRRLRALLALQF